MADLDQGGTFRQTQQVYLGPSIGWVGNVAVGTIIRVTVTGTTALSLGTSMVRVNVNASVTIQLPPAKGNTAGAGAVPGSFAIVPITVFDEGGHAVAFPITINPTGADLIDGLGSISISGNYGLLTLTPDPINGSWAVSQ